MSSDGNYGLAAKFYIALKSLCKSETQTAQNHAGCELSFHWLHAHFGFLRVKFLRRAMRRHKSCEPPRQEVTAEIRFSSVVGLALRNSGSSNRRGGVSPFTFRRIYVTSGCRRRVAMRSISQKARIEVS